MRKALIVLFGFVGLTAFPNSAIARFSEGGSPNPFSESPAGYRDFHITWNIQTKWKYFIPIGGVQTFTWESLSDNSAKNFTANLKASSQSSSSLTTRFDLFPPDGKKYKGKMVSDKNQIPQGIIWEWNTKRVVSYFYFLPDGFHLKMAGNWEDQNFKLEQISNCGPDFNTCESFTSIKMDEDTLGQAIKTINPNFISNETTGRINFRLFAKDSVPVLFSGIAVLLEELSKQHMSLRNESDLPYFQQKTEPDSGTAFAPDPVLEPDRKHWYSYFTLAGKLQSNFTHWEGGLDLGYHYYWKNIGLAGTAAFLARTKSSQYWQQLRSNYYLRTSETPYFMGFTTGPIWNFSPGFFAIAKAGAGYYWGDIHGLSGSGSRDGWGVIAEALLGFRLPFPIGAAVGYNYSGLPFSSPHKLSFQLGYFP